MASLLVLILGTLGATVAWGYAAGIVYAALMVVGGLILDGGDEDEAVKTEGK